MFSRAAGHFRRVGRATMRPMFRQSVDPLHGGRLSPELRGSLQLWFIGLKRGISQRAGLVVVRLPVVELVCGARGYPARVADVLCAQCGIWCTGAPPSARLLADFLARGEGQIMILELFAMFLGIPTFAHRIRGSSVQLWIDSVRGGRGLAKGAAAQPDRNIIVHFVLLFAARLQRGLWVERVPTNEDLADLPSREDYRLVQHQAGGFG